MCKRVSLVYAIQKGVLPKSYMKIYGNRAWSLSPDTSKSI